MTIWTPAEIVQVSYVIQYLNHATIKIFNHLKPWFFNIIVVCCCKLNHTRVCDELLFGQVSTCIGCNQLSIFCCTPCTLEDLFGQVSTWTGHYQLPIFRCTNVQPGRYTRSLIYVRHLRQRRVRMSSQQYIKEVVADPWKKVKPGVWDPSFPPKISIARFAITSFVFMLLWVPEPVCQITEINHYFQWRR